MRKWIIHAVLILFASGIILISLFYWHSEVEIYNLKCRYAYECPMHLQDLLALTQFYASSTGCYPSNMSYFINSFHIAPDEIQTRSLPFFCPGSQIDVPSAPVDKNISDYYYINWSKWFQDIHSIPSNFPVFYDCRLANHSGRGIYIICLDGTVMWDFEGCWIAHFASEHKKYHIPLPKDLKVVDAQ